MIVGFNLTKVKVERKKPLQGKITVNHDLRLDDVRKMPLPLKEKQEALVFDFTFMVMYEPGVGEAIIGGNVLYYADPKKIDSVYSQWTKSKKLPSDVSLEIINMIMAKCSVKTLELAHDLNLPSHLPLPQIRLQEDPSTYIG